MGNYLFKASGWNSSHLTENSQKSATSLGAMSAMGAVEYAGVPRN
jgi:hypothetical protein